MDYLKQCCQHQSNVNKSNIFNQISITILFSENEIHRPIIMLRLRFRLSWLLEFVCVQMLILIRYITIQLLVCTYYIRQLLRLMIEDKHVRKYSSYPVAKFIKLFSKCCLPNSLIITIDSAHGCRIKIFIQNLFPQIANVRNSLTSFNIYHITNDILLNC